MRLGAEIKLRGAWLVRVLLEESSPEEDNYDHSSEGKEDEEAEPEEQLKNQLRPKAVTQDEFKQTLQAIHILPEESNESESPSSSEEESDDEPEEAELPRTNQQ
ncbi:hypothetical protein N7491_006360 [Penicillium cf. griseofulvum]|nr:hypothetical protein N7491_006360 [Penicillium cf. griseofulvum]